jgi:hypothetical protein
MSKTTNRPSAKGNAELSAIGKAIGRSPLGEVDQRTLTAVTNTDGEAAGYALAQSAIAKAKGTGWLWFVSRLWMAAPNTREAFVKYIAKENREAGKHIKDKEGTHEHTLFRKARASAFTRLSELTQIAKAMNAGYDLPVKRDDSTQLPLTDSHGQQIPRDPFYTIVAECRMFNNSQAQGRGRPAKPFLEKLVAFLERETGKMNKKARLQAWRDAAELTHEGAEHGGELPKKEEPGAEMVAAIKPAV